MSDIFISYSRRDEQFARQLAEVLSDAGVDVWIDVDDIPAGMKWSTAVQKGLKLCQLMIVIISPESMASRNVEDEWQYYIDQKKPIVPVLRNPADIHFQLNRIQYIDFYHQPFEVALQGLFYELHANGINLAPGTVMERPKTQSHRPAFTADQNRRQAILSRGAIVGLLLLLLIGLPIVAFMIAILIQDPPENNIRGMAVFFVEDGEAFYNTRTAVYMTDTTLELTTTSIPIDQLALSLTATASAGVRLTVTDAVNVREGDSISFPVITVLERGQSATVLGVNGTRWWYFIEFERDNQRVRGWVSNLFMQFEGDTSTLPTLTRESAAELP